MGLKKAILITFLEGFAIIFIEILSKNILTPIFGSSLIVWTVVLGNTFLFLSLGYLLAIKFKEKNATAVLFKSIFLLSFLITLIPIAYNYFTQNLEITSLAKTTSFFHALFFGLVFILFGMINPLLISSLNQNENAKNTSLIFTFSTLGGILGAFLVNLIFISSFDINFALLGIAFVLFILSMLIFSTEFKKLTNIFIAVLFIGLSYYSFSFLKTLNKSNLYYSNNFYGEIKIFDKTDKITNTQYRFLNVNNIPQTIIINNKNVKSDWNYVHKIAMVSSLKKNKKAILFGMGGGSIASELQKLNLKLDVVDIDKRMFEIAQKYFYYSKKNSSFYVEDARFFINKLNKKYDLFVFDVLNGESQPNNLFTKEGIKKVKQLLKPRGIILIEFQENISKSKLAYQSICNTLLHNNLNVYTHVSEGDIADVLIVASNATVDFSKMKLSDFTPNSQAQKWAPAFISNSFYKINQAFPDAYLLEDDIPLLEKLNENTKLEWRQFRINQMKK